MSVEEEGEVTVMVKLWLDKETDLSDGVEPG